MSAAAPAASVAPAPFRVSTAPSLNLADAERETLEVDICIVGAGPAGLAAAYHLGKLVKKHNEDAGKMGTKPLSPSICILEKGAEIGHLGLSGGVMNPRAIVELLGDEWKPDEVPSCTKARPSAQAPRSPSSARAWVTKRASAR